MLIRQETLATYMPIHAVKPYGQNRRNGALFVAPRFMIPDDENIFLQLHRQS